MNSKKIRLLSTAILIAGSLLYLVSGALDFYFTIQMQGKIKAEGPEDPLEAWSEASYIVWKYNSTHYAARNMSTLLVEFGPSTNCTTVAQNAIDATYNAGGGTVFFKAAASKYRVSTPIVLRETVDIAGEGRQATTFDNDNPNSGPACSVFYMSGTVYNSITLRDFDVTGYGTDGPCISIYGTAIAEIYLENLWLHNAGDNAGSTTYSDGLLMVNVYTANIRSCIFSNNKLYGADISSCNAIRITDGCRFQDNKFGLRITEGFQNTVRDSTFENNDNIGLLIWSSSQTTIVADYFELNTNYDIKILSSAYGPADLNVIADCYFTSTPTAIILDATGNYYVGGTEIRHNFFNVIATEGVHISDVNCTHTQIKYNYWAGGFTEVYDSGTGTRWVDDDASGTAEASSGDWITHGLPGAPTIVIPTVRESDARYTVQCNQTSSTQFRIYLYDETAGAEELVNKTINWYAEYHA